MSEIKDKEMLRHLANQCMFDCSDDELTSIQEAFIILEKQMKLLEEIDTDGVEPMVYPFEAETTFLRDDDVCNVLTQEEAIANAAKTREGHVLVPKVVK